LKDERLSRRDRFAGRGEVFVGRGEMLFQRPVKSSSMRPSISGRGRV